jgi:peroxiredoxin family protein
VNLDATDRSLAEKLREMELRLAELERAQQSRVNGLMLIIFSGQMDKLLAAFTLATGAAAMGMTVSMFFTFWGLSAIKRRNIYRGKSAVERLLTVMLPSGPKKLGVSKMNMFGLGRLFFRSVMRSRRMESLERLIALADEMGVKMVACENSMEVMGLRRHELLDNVQCGGVATCLDTALSSGTTLFI